MDVGESQKNVTDVGKSHNYCTINQKKKSIVPKKNFVYSYYKH